MSLPSLRFQKTTLLGCLSVFVLLSALGCSEVIFESHSDNNSTLGDSTNPNSESPEEPEPDLPGPPDNPCDELSNCVLHEHIIEVKAPTNKVDIVVIVDNSASMSEDIESLGNQISGLTDVLQGLDWQMCFTTTDIYSESGRFLDWMEESGNSVPISTGSPVLSPDVAGYALQFNTTMSHLNSNGDGNERGIMAANLSIYHSYNQDCFRDEAVLMTLVISDEDEASCGGLCENMPGPPGDPNRYSSQYEELDPNWNTPESFIEHVKYRWGSEKVSISHSLVISPGDQACFGEQDQHNPAYYGNIYANLTETTGGILGDVCALENSYTEQLENMGEVTVEALSSVLLECTPVGDVTITPLISSAHSTSGNRLNFNPALEQGTEIIARYYCLE